MSSEFSLAIQELIKAADSKDEKAALIQTIIDYLAEANDLPRLTLKLDGRLGRALGRAQLRLNIILINPLIIDTTELDDTIRHEVAHFLAYKRGSSNHNDVWKEAAIELGARPRAIQEFNSGDDPKGHGYRYRYECEKGCIWYARRAKRTLEYKSTTCSIHRLPIRKVIL